MARADTQGSFNWRPAKARRHHKGRRFHTAIDVDRRCDRAADGHVRKGRHKPTPWLAALLERKPPKLVAVALANKFARIAWRLMMSGGVYNQPVAAMPI